MKFSGKSRFLWRSVAIILTGTAVALAAWIPVHYESQSLFYKFGLEKTMLQGGKALGWLLLVVMAAQVFLAARPPLAPGVVSLKEMTSLHRACGMLAGGLVLLHPLLILGADGFSLFPPELRYWPEWLGSLTAVVLVFIVLVSLLRARMNMAYGAWRTLHRIGTPVVILSAFAHAFFVSETFHHTVPRLWLVLLLAAAAAIFLRVYINRISGSFRTGGSRRIK